MTTNHEHGHRPTNQTQHPTHHEQQQEPETEQRSRTTPDTGHYAEQPTRHDQQDTRTKRSRERSNDSHLGITILGCAPAAGRLESRATGDRPGRRSACSHVDLAGWHRALPSAVSGTRPGWSLC
jgi:hypothetical protein